MPKLPVIVLCAALTCGATRPLVAQACAGMGPVAREDAVVRGVQWLARFVRPPARARALGIDATTMFREIGETTISPRVAALAMPIARRLAQQRYAAALRQTGLDAPSDVADAAWILADAAVLGLADEPLHERIRQRLAVLTTSRALYGVDLDHLEALSEDDLFQLLMRTYKLEKGSTRFDDLRTPVSLADVLAFIWRKPLVVHDDTDHGRFLDHAYLATHVAYVLDDFSRTALAPDTLGPLFVYLRREFPGVLAQRDLELVAEFVDVFRSLGFDDRDPMVCAGSRFVLGQQRSDGSFSPWRHARFSYDAAHPTWVALGALRDRCVLPETPFARRMSDVVADIRQRIGLAVGSAPAPEHLLPVCASVAK